MSTDFGFGGEAPKRSSNAAGSVLNTLILVVGVVLFFLYGIFKLTNPAASIGESGLSVAANIAGAVGIIVIIVALVRIRLLNRRKTRGY